MAINITPPYNLTPYNRSDFFFTKYTDITVDELSAENVDNYCKFIPDDSEAWTETVKIQTLGPDEENTVTVNASDLEKRATISACKRDYVNEIMRNRTLYDTLAKLQESTSSSEQRFNDVEEKYDYDLLSISTNIMGCLILLGIIYKLQ